MRIDKNIDYIKVIESDMFNSYEYQHVFKDFKQLAQYIKDSDMLEKYSDSDIHSSGITMEGFGILLKYLTDYITITIIYRDDNYLETSETDGLDYDEAKNYIKNEFLNTVRKYIRLININNLLR